MQTTSSCNHLHDTSVFDRFNSAVQNHFAAVSSGRENQLFTVPTDGLFDLYLSGFPEAERQEHNCHCCRHFMKNYGGLVVVEDNGHLKSAIWPLDEEGEYGPSSRLVAAEVRRSKINGVFMTNEKRLGVQQTGIWTHFHIQVSPALRQTKRPDYLNAARALKIQDMETVQRALAEFSSDTINTALGLLRSESLYRSEKVLGPCEWLHEVRTNYDRAKGEFQRNLLWRFVAQAPAGFCTPRSSMIGTLLEDIANGLTYDEVKRRFAAKMNPNIYQRPQVPATAGNIAQAEKLIAEMGLEPALHRRYARLDEIQTLWAPKPAAAPAKSEGVFGHLSPKGTTKPLPIVAKAGAITWDKFQRTVLPTAESIEFYIVGNMNWIALLTATNADAPPILQWDREEARNPVSWYVYNNGSPSLQWKIAPQAFHKVNAVTLQPSMWNGGNEHQGKSVIFIIDGAADKRKPSMGLFPEILRSELHGVRATIEAHSRSGSPSGREKASACGIRICNGESVSSGLARGGRVRVTSSTGVTEYTIDRWD